MNSIIKTMIESYPEYKIEKDNVLRQVLQDVILCSLYKTNFFNKAVFIGGTALRIFHNLDRFSEDLDFAMVDDTDFNFDDYIPKIINFVSSFGLKCTIVQKPNSKQTYVYNVRFELQDLYDMYYPEEKINANQRVLRIEIDIDRQRVEGIQTESLYRLMPQNYSATLFNRSTLFASKIAAILLRTWNERGFKGRDLYDYIFYLSNNVGVNLKYLKEKLILSGKFKKNENLTLQRLKQMLINRFESIPYKLAIDDVKPFIRDVDKLNIWSKDFFIGITNQLKEE